MMWIAHKAKEGDTLDSIAKLYKNKDPKAILKYHMNKKITKRLEKGEAMKRGEVVWVLNPKSKVYTVSNGKCNVLLDECGYKKTLKEVNRVMDRVLEMQRINYEAACKRHDMQIEINKAQKVVAFIAQGFNDYEEPLQQWRAARAAYKKLGGIVKGRNYKGFQKAAINCELAVSTYASDVRLWVHGLIDVVETTHSGMQFVKAAGEFCLYALIVTACAPASLAAGVVIGAGASASAGLVYDGYENVGRMLAGEKTMSYSELGDRMMKKAISGAAGALIVGSVMKLAGPHLSKAMMNNSFMSKWVPRISRKILPKKLIDAEALIVQKTLAKKGITPDKIDWWKAMDVDKIAIDTLVKFMGRIDGGAIMRIVNSKVHFPKLLFDWVSSYPAELKGKDEGKIGAAAGKYIIDNGGAEYIMQQYLQQNVKAFRKELRQAIMDEALKMEKQAA